MKSSGKYIILLILFILLQVIWFSHILLFGLYSPLIFIYPLLILPLEKNETFSLLTAFITGLIIDLINNTGGVFAATAVSIVYFRKIYFYLIKNPAHTIES
jgi:rod shape-determining protein MreD